MNYKYSSLEDKLLYQQMLNGNIKLLVGNNSLLSEQIVREFFSKLDYLQIISWSKKHEFNKDVHGETKFSDNGHTGIKMYGMGDYKGDKEYIEKLFSHEIWHALMTVLNNVYGNNESRIVELDHEEVQVVNYSGFYKCKSKSQEFMVGYLLVEVMADILTHIVYELQRDDNADIDEAFYYMINDIYCDALYDDFLTLGQLFIAAFNLDSSFCFKNIYQRGKGLLNYQIKVGNKFEVANVFIDSMIKNPLLAMDSYDQYMGSGSYISLLRDLDLVYYDYCQSLKINTNILKEIVNNLSVFTSKRINDYYSAGKINQVDKNLLLSNYDELLAVFKEEIECYERKKKDKNITNIFKKLKKI